VVSKHRVQFQWPGQHSPAQKAVLFQDYYEGLLDILHRRCWWETKFDFNYLLSTFEWCTRIVLTRCHWNP